MNFIINIYYIQNKIPKFSTKTRFSEKIILKNQIPTTLIQKKKLKLLCSLLDTTKCYDTVFKTKVCTHNQSFLPSPLHVCRDITNIDAHTHRGRVSCRLIADTNISATYPQHIAI